MSLRDLKGLLLFFMLIGAAAYFGGGATFASFSAETSNAGSAIASGTLTMSDQVNSGTICLSAGSTSLNNVNPACSQVLALTNVAPGVYGGVAQVTVQNTGSIDASKFWLWAPPVNATLSATATGSISSLTVTPLEGTVTSGDTITLTYGSHTQTNFTAGAAGAAGGATSIPLNTQTTNFAYPAGTIVQDTSSNTTASNTDCYDAKTTVPGTAGATAGNALNFNPVTGNPFCGTALMFVQETTAGKFYCWLGQGFSITNPQPSGGICTAPISVALTTGLTSGASVSTLAVAALNGNVKSGDSIVVTSGASTQTFTAGANALFGATTITLSCTPSCATANANYTTATTTVTDSSALSALNSDTTDTLTNFDTAHSALAGHVQLLPLSANGTTTTGTGLSHFNSGTYSRTFEVGVYLPAPGGSNQNPLQGLQSTFGITWHVDQ